MWTSSPVQAHTADVVQVYIEVGSYTPTCLDGGES